MAVRPIDAMQLKQRMCALCNRYYSDEPCESSDCVFVRAINEAPTFTPPSEWVSVEERLPRVCGNYICAVQDKNGGTWTIPAEWNLEMKTWFGAFGEIKNKVTHWMPLPEPPKEG